MTDVRTLAVAADEAGLRLDRWFRRRFPGLSHGRLEKLLRTGQVRVDGRRAKAGARLEVGQQVRVPPLGEAAEMAAPPAAPSAPKVSERDRRMLERAVLHMDSAVLVIDKPAGLAVQGGSGTSRHLDAMLDGLRFDAKERPRLVHRLDKDTSGVLVLARSAGAARWLARAFQGKAVSKLYWAIVAGVPTPPQGRVDLPLAKGGGAAERMHVDREEGRRAVTDYAVIDRAGRRAAWLALRPVTGRTHQLRAHCAALGTPILGDGKYGGRDAFLPGLALPRQLHLHARAVRFPHPDGGEVAVEAPPPPHLREAMRLLGFSPADYRDPFDGIEG